MSCDFSLDKRTNEHAVHRIFSLAIVVPVLCLAAAAGVVNCHTVAEKASKLPSVQKISSRRCLLRKAFFTTAVVSSNVVQITSSPLCVSAAENPTTEATAPQNQGGNGGGKPYAPVEALLPATRCKVWIDRAHGISSQLSPYVGATSNGSEDNEQAVKLLKELDQILSEKPRLFTDNERRSLRNSGILGATAQITASVSRANKNQYQQNRENLSIPNKFAAIINQADVERQWGMLRYAESNREKDNPIRAAFNYYTQQLVFDGDSYLLTASKEEKKQMIRSGKGLPSLTAVVTSDLDLRDLYRNQLLTAIDDAVAEVSYQVKQPSKAIDLADTVLLMNQAHVACDNWFALISGDDVREALKSVSSER